MTSSPDKRPWQFSLRSLLVLMTVWAILLSVVTAFPNFAYAVGSSIAMAVLFVVAIGLMGGTVAALLWIVDWLFPGAGQAEAVDSGHESQEPHPPLSDKKSWQFSLRSLLLVTTVWAVVLSTVAAIPAAGPVLCILGSVVAVVWIGYHIADWIATH
jgi:hypothetical protein